MFWKIELQCVLVAMHYVKFNSTVFGTWQLLAKLVASVIELVNLKFDRWLSFKLM